MRTTHRVAAAVVSTAAVAIIAASCAAEAGTTPAPARTPVVHVVQYQPPDVLKNKPASSGGAGLSGLHVPHPRLHVLRRPYLFRRHYLFRFGSRRNSNG